MAISFNKYLKHILHFPGDLPTVATTSTTEEPTTVPTEATTPAETAEPETPEPPEEITTTTEGEKLIPKIIEININ